MEIIMQLVSFIFHLDKHLNTIIQNYGTWTYCILFLIIFCETGLVVTPFLPGDSLLFATGALAGLGTLKINWLLAILISAAIIGDNLNYWIGYFIGPKVFHKEKAHFLKKEYLVKTHMFYEKYGVKTIILARFVPIIRTFAPFVAGLGRMNYLRFLSYDIAGGILWVGTFVGGGYFFGNMPVIKKNFSISILLIIFISLVPGIIEFYRHKRAAQHRS